jgi:hypothetical protein
MAECDDRTRRRSERGVQDLRNSPAERRRAPLGERRRAFDVGVTGQAAEGRANATGQGAKGGTSPERRRRPRQRHQDKPPKAARHRKGVEDGAGVTGRGVAGGAGAEAA